MNKNQWNEFLEDLSAVFEKHGFTNRAIKVSGQAETETKIQTRKSWEFYDAATYGSPATFEEFQRTKDLKLVWARMSSSVKEYQLDPILVANISPDYCPVTGALIDYGYGFNRITDNPYFRPGIDHKIAVGNGGAKYGDITNIQIVSEFFNTIKNYGTMINAIQWLGFELRNRK
jgi:hypothetical protein